jgi:hypothetical protein
VLGVCKTRGGVGALCGKDFDCLGPLSCQNGTCNPRQGVGGACDSNNDCLFDSTSNSQPICSGGICRLPNGATCTSASDCAIGVCLDCTYIGGGRICGECCKDGGLDPVDCGDEQSEKLCCNHQCIYRNDDNNCGACGIDCTCGGTDPLRYCTTEYDASIPSWAWDAVCDGYYSSESGHCLGVNENYCADSSTGTCVGAPCADCDCSQGTATSIFCYACCVGSFPGLELSTCADIGEDCISGNDDSCCGNAVCSYSPNCSPGTVFCLSNDYKCAAS